MAGVKRSKACITCIERKKGCDGQRPTCKQCQKARKVCRGYNRAMTFINKIVPCGHGDRPLTTPRVRSIEPSLTKELMQSAYENKYIGYFWQSYFPNGEPIPLDIVNSGLGGWMHHVQSLCATDETTKHTLLALSVATIAEQDESATWMSLLGRRLYTSALQRIAERLQCPRDRQADSVLASVRLLGLYEILYGEEDEGLTRATNWLAHGYGSTALVMERGPMSFSCKPQSQKLFADWRLYLILVSIIDRKETFLRNPSWRTTPWRHTSKTPYDSLLDILACVPSILGTADTIRAPNLDHTIDDWRLLRGEYIQLEERLAQWYEKFGNIIISSEECFQAVDEITPQKLATAHISTLYWTTCVIIYGLVGQVMVQNGQAGPEGRYADPLTYCSRILDTSSLFLHPAVGVFRSHLLTLPLIVTMSYIATLPTEDWPKDRALLLKCLNNKSCSAIRKFLCSLMPRNFEILESGYS